MTADEYHDLLLIVGLSQSAAARRIFGVGVKTARDWANPTMGGPPEIAARLLRLVHYLMDTGRIRAR